MRLNLMPVNESINIIVSTDAMVQPVRIFIGSSIGVFIISVSKFLYNRHKEKKQDKKIDTIIQKVDYLITKKEEEEVNKKWILKQ